MPGHESPPKARSSGLRAPIRRWLILYNVVSLCLWAACLLGLALHVSDVYSDHRRLGNSYLTRPLRWAAGISPSQSKYVKSAGDYSVYTSIGTLVLGTQSLALLEILHIILAFVRSSLVTTVVQVFSRLLLVALCHAFPSIPRQSPVYTTMTLAWSLTEVVRYGSYAANLAGQKIYPLAWLRYNMFLVLYPLGAGSEFVILFKATTAGMIKERFGSTASGLGWVVLVAYVPGLYVLYNHMLRQRRKFYRDQKAMTTR